MANKIQIRRDTAANWTSANPTLSQGEQGYETDTGKLKIGNGSTAWTSLGYSFVGYTDSDVDTHLNTSTATSGELLSWTGTDYDWIAAASGADLYAANESSPTAQPSATGANAIAIGDSASASGSDSIAIGLGAISTSSGSVAFPNSRAAIADSIAGAIGSNSTSYGTSGGTGTIAFGISSKANAFWATAIGRQNTASNTGALALGYVNTASAVQSQAIGAYSIASEQYSLAMGHRSNSNIKGKFAYTSDRFSSTGDAQTGIFVLRSDTTDATAEALTTDNSTAAATNQIILPNNSAYSFSGTIIARESAAASSDYASWEIKGALLRDATAASTVLGNGIVNKLYATAGASTWAVALTADTTNGGLKVEVTGAAATNIRWVATVNTSEVTYA